MSGVVWGWGGPGAKTQEFSLIPLGGQCGRGSTEGNTEQWVERDRVLRNHVIAPWGSSAGLCRKHRGLQAAGEV